MNTFFAASLFDSPWVIVVIAMVAAVSNWLMKRRQGNQAENRPDGDESLPSPGKPPNQSQRQLDFQEALRELMGGEPPPRAPQPPPVLHDAQGAEVGSNEEQFQREETWVDELQETYEADRPPLKAFGDSHARTPPALSRADATRIEASELQWEAARRFEQLNEQGRHPATAVDTGRGRRSLEGARAAAMVRDPRTVRQAFVASLVFGPPKAFET